MGGHINRPRDREHAPANSGSSTKPERVNVRCTTEECGRFLTAIGIAQDILKARDPKAVLDITTAIHHVIVPVFEKVIRAYRFGSSAEQASARVYLEEFVRKEDYLKNRKDRYQAKFKFSV